MRRETQAAGCEDTAAPMIPAAERGHAIVGGAPGAAALRTSGMQEAAPGALTGPDESAARAVLEGTGMAVLARVAEPGVAAALWRRGLDPLFVTWLEGLSDEALPAGRIVAAPGEVAAAVEGLCVEAGLPEGPGRRMLGRDAAALAHELAAVLRTPTVRLRLDAVRGDACRRFHLDAVEARLLCTYRGRGTEYGLARPDGDPDPVRHLPAGTAAIFRGRLWRGEPCGLVHRSPPMRKGDRARLLLVIDGPEPEE